MGGMKDRASGNSAPSRTPYMRIGRFGITTSPGKVWITDAESGEGGSFEESSLEAALLKFFSEEF